MLMKLGFIGAVLGNEPGLKRWDHLGVRFPPGGSV